MTQRYNKKTEYANKREEIAEFSAECGRQVGMPEKWTYKKNAGYNPAEWTEKDGEKKKIPHSTKKEEAVFASSFLFIATMSRL